MSNENNIITITSDTEKGPIVEEVNLDEMSLEELAMLAPFAPQVKEYYGNRLVKELKN